MSLNGDSEKQHDLDPNTEVEATAEKEHVLGRFKGTASKWISSPISSPILILACTLVMLTWPWMFLGIVWARDGVQLNNHAAKFIINNAHVTNYLVTFIGTIISIIVGILLSLAVTRLAREWDSKGDPITVFHVISLSAFKHHSWPWNLKDSITHLFDPKTSLAVVFIGVCVLALTTITSSITSLITPVPFTRTLPLQGTELDFSTNDTVCLQWLNQTVIPNNCDWQPYMGQEYTNCLGENQLVDVLEAARNNILSLLTSNPQSLILSQLSGLRFLVPMSGVLPNGPNGAPAFNTLQDSPFLDAKRNESMLSYNYTLENQGFISNVTCSYEPTSVIVSSPVSSTERFVFQYNGFCAGGADVLMDLEQYVTINGNSTLASWACKSAADETTEPSYFIYLRGATNYNNAIGNITCTVSPIQPAIYPVTYHSTSDSFSSAEAIANSTTMFSKIIDQAVTAIGDIIWESQNWEINSVAESVFTLGVKYFGFPKPDTEQNTQYLPLFASMIQGIIDYEATYIRLLYSSAPNRPSSCNRTMNGSLRYQVIGWSVEPTHIGILMPMTLVNLASLILILTAIFISKPGHNRVDPTDPRQLIYSTYIPGQNNAWQDRVMFPGRVSNPVPSTD